MKLVDPTGMYWAPGTNPPDTGTAGPWGPCYMCHDFEGGTKEERDKAYQAQEDLRQGLTQETKSYFQKNFGIDIDKELQPGHGTTVNLDRRGGKGWDGKYSLTGNPWDNDIHIDLDKASPGSSQFSEVLLHESGHWAADMATWFGAKEPGLDDATRQGIDGIISQYPALGFRMFWEGYSGYGAEWSQYGGLPSLVP